MPSSNEDKEVTLTETTDTESMVKDYVQISEELDNTVKTLLDSLRTVKQLKKDLDKVHQRELKNMRKKKKNVSGSKSNKEPSGFNKPAPVPKEFTAQPWGCENGQMVPRTQLTKMVYDYIKDNDLQDPADRRIIHPDKNVRTLFHLDSGQDLEFKTFQTYMAKLYKKKTDDDEVEVEVEVEPAPVEVKKPAPKKRANKKAKPAKVV